MGFRTLVGGGLDFTRNRENLFIGIRQQRGRCEEVMVEVFCFYFFGETRSSSALSGTEGP